MLEDKQMVKHARTHITPELLLELIKPQIVHVHREHGLVELEYGGLPSDAKAVRCGVDQRTGEVILIFESEENELVEVGVGQLVPEVVVTVRSKHEARVPVEVLQDVCDTLVKMAKLLACRTWSGIDEGGDENDLEKEVNELWREVQVYIAMDSSTC